MGEQISSVSLTYSSLTSALDKPDRGGKNQSWRHNFFSWNQEDIFHSVNTLS